MEEDHVRRISALEEALEAVMVSNYEMQANHVAAMQMLLRVIALAEQELKPGEKPAETYLRLRKVALEEIVLSLGDKNPALADEVQRAIDRIKGSSGQSSG